jgi:hypothetical protein
MKALEINEPGGGLLTGRRLPAGQKRNLLCASVSLWFGLLAAQPRCGNFMRLPCHGRLFGNNKGSFILRSRIQVLN